jgi:hypothetical protein
MMMDTKAWMMMRVLFNRFHDDTTESLLAKHAPKEMQEQISSQKITNNDPLAAWVTPLNLINKIHYSWLCPIIEELPKNFHPYFLSALPETHFLGITKMLNKEPTRIPLNNDMRSFFISQLCSYLNVTGLLLPTFLPTSKLSFLADLNKQQIIEVVDFLALHDLAEEMRFILNKNQLKVLFSQLSQKKQKYLKMCMANKERFPVARLALEQWKGTKSQLDVMLHKRGLERLGKTLAGQHHDLIWYIAHMLDTGRGALLIKTIPLHEEQGVTSYRVQQLLQLINFLKQEAKGE